MSAAASAGRVVWLESVAELDRGRWAALARAGDIEHTTGYLAFLEAEDPGGRRLLVLRDGRGDYLAGCAVSQLSDRTVRSSRAADLLTDPATLRLPAGATALPVELATVLDAYAGPAPAELGAALRHARQALNRVVGLPLAVRSMWDSSLLVSPELTGADRRRAAAALLTGLLREAVRRGHRSVAFLYAPAADRELARLLGAAGFVSGTVRGLNRVHLAGCRTVEDYLRRFPRRRRSTLRREAAAAAGLSVLDHRDAAVVDRAVAFEHANSARYGRPVAVADLRRVHERLTEALPERVRLYGAERDGRLVATHLVLRGERKYASVMYGADYEAVGADSGLYPPLTCHRPVADALAERLAAVDLGPDAHDGKMLRGARLLDLRTHLWSATPEGTAFARDWLAVVDARTQEAFGELRQRYAGRDRTLTDEPDISGVSPAPSGKDAQQGRPHAEGETER